MTEIGPLGCIIREEYTLESDEQFAQATGQSVLWDQSAAEFHGRWKSLVDRGITGVFLWEAHKKKHPLVFHHQRRGTCVARGFHGAVQSSYIGSLANRVAVGEPVEIAWEPIYPGSRVYVGKGRISGDGSVGAWAAQWVAGINGVGGVCARGVYGSADLQRSNESWAVANAGRGDSIPGELLAECARHTCRVFRVQNNTNFADSISSNFAIARCWDTLFGPRDRNGFSEPSRRGAHCQTVNGVCLDENGELCFIEKQSWGKNNPTGPRTLRYAGGEIELPDQHYAVKARHYEYAQSRSRWWEAHAVSIRRGQEFRVR